MNFFITTSPCNCLALARVKSLKNYERRKLTRKPTMYAAKNENRKLINKN